ncbi:MAG: HI0074 family nucleotidyltransferase substrate-binding subunit [Casimicrobiaceae bacterium]
MADPNASDLTPLERAIATLAEAIGFWREEPADSGRKTHLRAGAIQAFEFTYELAVRSLRRVLLDRALVPTEVSSLSFADLLRHGADAGLLASPNAWRRWRELRNRTSHAYDERQAEAIMAELEAFLADARALLAALRVSS